MATFRVTDPSTGKTVKLTGDSPPSEQELEQIFSQIQPAEVLKQPEQKPEEMVGGRLFGQRVPGVTKALEIPKSEFEEGQRNVLGNIFERPAAAVRGGIQALPPGGETPSEGFTKGSIDPASVPTFQELALDKFTPGTRSTVVNFLGGIIPSSIGFAMDVVTNPANLLLSLIGKVPTGKGVSLAGKVGKTKAIKKFQQFLTKERGIPGRELIRNINKTFRNVKDPVKLAKKTRTTVFNNKREVGEEFGKGIEKLSEQNPNKTVDLSNQFEVLRNAVDDVASNPGLKGDVKGIIRKVKNPQDSQLIQSLIDEPAGAKSLTLQQAQTVKNAIQKSPSIANKLKQGKFANWQSGDIELLDLLDEISLEQSSIFPEIADVRKPYANFMNAYREVKSSFKPKVLIDKMKTGFGNEEIQSMIKVVLPKDTIKELEAFRKATSTIKAGRLALGVGTGAAVAGLIGRKIFGER